MDSVHLSAVHQNPQHHRGGTQGDDGAEGQRLGQRHKDRRHQGEDSQRGRHLKGPAPQGDPAQAFESTEGKLQADGEQQQGHPKFGHINDRPGVEEQGADQRAGQQVSNDGALLQALGDRSQHKGGRQQDQNLHQQLPEIHGHHSFRW